MCSIPVKNRISEKRILKFKVNELGYPVHAEQAKRKGDSAKHSEFIIRDKRFFELHGVFQFKNGVKASGKQREIKIIVGIEVRTNLESKLF